MEKVPEIFIGMTPKACQNAQFWQFLSLLSQKSTLKTPFPFPPRCVAPEEPEDFFFPVAEIPQDPGGGGVELVVSL